jgi:hypothetical protein
MLDESIRLLRFQIEQAAQEASSLIRRSVESRGEDAVRAAYNLDRDEVAALLRSEPWSELTFKVLEKANRMDGEARHGQA